MQSPRHELRDFEATEEVPPKDPESVRPALGGTCPHPRKKLVSKSLLEPPSLEKDCNAETCVEKVGASILREKPPKRFEFTL